MEAVDKRDAPFRLFPSWRAQPGIEYITQRRHDGSGRFRPYLHEVDVFGVACRRVEIELVERRTAPKRQRLAKKRVGEYSDQPAANYQVLLDLGVGHPWRLRPPFSDVVARDQRSI